MTYFEENPAVAKALLSKSLDASRAREAARKARDNARNKTGLESSKLPGKLADCSSNDPSCAKFTSSRVIPQAAPPRTDGTVPTRPFCPFGVKC